MSARERPETFNGVKVFSATQHRERIALGETVERWLAEHPAVSVVDFVVTQSSDAAFHCVSICVFFRELSGPNNVGGELGTTRPSGECGAQLGGRQ